MSVSMLGSFEPSFSATPNHDQLDDLESFYYVLYDLMFTWAGVGIRAEHRPRNLIEWEMGTAIEQMSAKGAHYCDGARVRELPSFWLPAARNLLRSFHRLTYEMVQAKCVVHDLTDDTSLEAYKALLARADEYYDRIVALFDEAIIALSDEESNESNRDPPCATETENLSTPAPSPVVTEEPKDGVNTSDPSVSPSVVKDGYAGTQCSAVSQRPLLVDPPSPLLSTINSTPKRKGVDSSEGGAPLKRQRLGQNPSPCPPRTRKPTWIRTSPHRTRAWVKANAVVS